MAENTNVAPFAMRRRISFDSLLLFSYSAVVGFVCWKAPQNWFVGALAFIAFWIVLGLLNQSRDIWLSLRQGEILTSEQRWALYYALAWRITLCCLFVVCFVVRSSGLFSPVKFSANMGYDAFWKFFIDVFNDDSPRVIWDSVLLLLIIAALIGSRDMRLSGLRRPWALVLNSLGAIAAAVLFLVVLENRYVYSYLIHVTIVGMMTALNSPSGPVPELASEIVKAASRTRISLFYAITTAGVVSVLVNGFLCWELSIRWRRGGWPRICLAALLAAGLIVMLLLAGRVVFVELPTISPLMYPGMAIPPMLNLAAAVILVAGMATAVAGRWATLPFAGPAPVRESWWRAPRRYYHERPILLFSLGVILLADVLVLGYRLSPWPRMNPDEWAYLFTSTKSLLTLILFILIGQAIFWKWRYRSTVIATEQPQMSPGLFVSLWSALMLIIVCGAPIFSAWHFASFLKSGYISP